MKTETELDTVIKNLPNLPYNYGIDIDFYPSDKFLERLTKEYGIEFASVFNHHKKQHQFYFGDKNSVTINNSDGPVLIKHTHPNGTELPSIFDINWLKQTISNGSPQKKSYILPLGKKRSFFNIKSKFLS
ncbi:hypothetical protein [Tenacibaculum maritimum]|uniref:hypothetical protein n=1 Tax=Tenacibaculum maritimum TaxID=107401 RepID=UPI00388F2173